MMITVITTAGIVMIAETTIIQGHHLITGDVSFIMIPVNFHEGGSSS